jgi:L-threonylcarbamoyladenylate synthase
MKIILENNPDSAKIAADFLRQQKAISFATDTVYGIAVDATNLKAIEHLYAIKKRDKNKPITIFLKEESDIEKIFIFDKITKKIADKFLFDGLTLVLKKRHDSHDSSTNLASNLNINDDFLGFRIVKNKFISELFKNFDYPLAVTSANISGFSAAISAEEIKSLDIDLLIDGGICQKKIPSTVVKIIDNKVIILREGAINSQLIESLINSEHNIKIIKQ